MGGQQHPGVMGKWEAPPAPLALQCLTRSTAHGRAKCRSEPGENIFHYFCYFRLHALRLLGKINRTFALKQPNL